MPKCLVPLLVTVLACVFSACDYIEAYRPPWLNYSPQRTYYSSYRHSRSERLRTVRSRSVSRESGDTAEVDHSSTGVTEHAVPVPASVSKPEVSLSLAGDSEDREQAQRLLEEADETLVRARGRRLTQAQKETYERASQLASRARRALADDDCAAASSLAGKASSLAAGIGGR